MTDGFENHCWIDMIPSDVIEVYKQYRREIYVGPSPALVAIDLYELAYQGGAKPPVELQGTYPSSCGQYAHAAIEPTRRLLPRGWAPDLLYDRGYSSRQSPWQGRAYEEA